MNGAILMLAAAAAQIQTCPPVSELSRTTPVALRIQKRLPSILARWRIAPEKGGTTASTSYFPVEGVPTSFHVVRSPGAPGTTQLLASCAAPWGEIMCARTTFRSDRAAPDVFVRLKGDRTILVVRYDETTGRRYQVLTLDQTSGFRKVCG